MAGGGHCPPSKEYSYRINRPSSALATWVIDVLDSGPDAQYLAH